MEMKNLLLLGGLGWLGYVIYKNNKQKIYNNILYYI